MKSSFELVKSFAEAQGRGRHDANGEERHGENVGLDHFESDTFKQ